MFRMEMEQGPRLNKVPDQPKKQEISETDNRRNIKEKIKVYKNYNNESYDCPRRQERKQIVPMK